MAEILLSHPFHTCCADHVRALLPTWKKVGGITFFRWWRIRFSFCLARR